VSFTTPAAQLARLKCVYRDWSLSHTGDLYLAVHRTDSRLVRGTSPADLENKLIREYATAGAGRKPRR
jgi:hypothetical protein